MVGKGWPRRTIEALKHGYNKQLGRAQLSAFTVWSTAELDSFFDSLGRIDLDWSAASDEVVLANIRKVCAPFSSEENAQIMRLRDLSLDFQTIMHASPAAHRGATSRFAAGTER